ncbi:MAG: DUF3291 domain-containing protein [Sphingobacteriaceae bacterium]
MIISFTINRYRKAAIPLALLAMAIHRLPMRLQQGCSFWKLLGTGRNGTFDLEPDWQQWGLLAVWDSREDFDRFFKNSFVAYWWRLLSRESWTVLCEPMESHGKWDGKEPFGRHARQIHDGPVAVLTRATIRWRKLKGFWSNVDHIANIMAKAPGYITSVGVGEAPIYRQATFSFWENETAMKHFAYKSPEHAEVIKKTRAGDWYSEELFARFKPVESFGSMMGKDPLKGWIPTHSDNLA